METIRLTIFLVTMLTVTVIRAQLPSIGTCHETGMCVDTEPQTDMTYEDCCSNLSRRAFRSSGSDVNGDDGDRPFGCMACPTATCYTDEFNCTTGGMTVSLPRPTTIMECCGTQFGLSFNDGFQCTNCPECYTEDMCDSGAISAAGRESMTVCCDNENGVAYMDTAGICNPCATGGMGMDPHFAVPLLNGQDICYSLQGEPYFAFNLISDPVISINSYFIPPEKGKNLTEFATFLGDIGIIVQPEQCMGNCVPYNITKIVISASDRSVLIEGSKTKVKDRNVQVLVDDSIATVKLGNVLGKEDHPSLTVTIKHPPLAFKVQFVNEHLDLIVKDFSGISSNAHGIMGQFLRRPAKLTDDGFLSINGKKIRIVKDAAWEFLHTNTQCLHAKPSYGIQADGIIEGKYTDYIVEGLFSPDFEYSKFKGTIKN